MALRLNTEPLLTFPKVAARCKMHKALCRADPVVLEKPLIFADTLTVGAGRRGSSPGLLSGVFQISPAHFYPFAAALVAVSGDYVLTNCLPVFPPDG